MTVLFGLNVSAGDDPITDALKAESLGFDFVSAFDHLHGDAPSFEPWTLLATIAARTTRLKVATRVLAVPYRHPAVLAKMAETLDRLSGGRLILGLGGGYSDEEFAAFGLPAHTAGEKIEGLEEAIHVIRGLWREVRFTFEGSFYRVRASRIEPKPSHRIPIWLGTFRPRGLDLTGRLADGWIPSYGTAGPDSVVRLRGRVMAAAAESGRNPDEILCVYNIAIRVGNGDGDPETLAGSADELVEQLARFRALGFGAFNLIPQGPDLAEQHERLAREVLPSARMS